VTDGNAPALLGVAVACVAALAAGATGGGPATAAPSLVGVFAFHAAHVVPALLSRGVGAATDSAFITHAALGASAAAGFLTAHVQRWSVSKAKRG